MDPAPEPSGLADRARLFGVYLEYAQQSERARPEQIAALQEAVDSGQLSFETMVELNRLMFACFDKADVGYSEPEPIELGVGYLLPVYSWDVVTPGRSDEETERAADVCIDGYNYWASMAYQDERLYADAREALWERELPRVKVCLEQAGAPVDADASVHEVRLKIRDLMNSNERGAGCALPGGMP